MNAVIFANADIYNYDFCSEYLNQEFILICCDGGIRHAKALKLKPDYILGDFDSAENELLNYYKQQDINIKSFPPKKNYTDMELAVEFALELKADHIIIFGGVGSRFDHTLTNAHILKRALDKDVDAVLIDNNNSIRLINKYIQIKGKKGNIVSLIPLSTTVEGVTTKNLEYPLFDYNMKIGSSLGVSNVMLNDTAYVNIKSGYLFVIMSKDWFLYKNSCTL